MDRSPLLPRQPVPDITVDLLDGGDWRLSERRPKSFTMLVVYRGLHCPVCAGYLADLDKRTARLAERGVEVLAASSDSRERATTARASWKLGDLPLGYGLTIEQGRSLGLYVSSGRGKTSVGIEEPDLFLEPGLFLVRPDRTLYFASVQTMPFARPGFADIEKALDFVIANNYPARGEVAG